MTLVHPTIASLTSGVPPSASALGSIGMPVLAEGTTDVLLCTAHEA